jgi:GTP-binding protein HflX
MDAGSPEIAQQHAAVKKVLSELGIDEKLVINVLNKVDIIPSAREIERLAQTWSAIPVSALTGAGIADLMHLLTIHLAKVTVCHFKLPYSDLTALDFLHTRGKVVETRYPETGIEVTVEIDPKITGKYQRYLV